jgi:putative salt-induced outer membrane protein YdiY
MNSTTLITLALLTFFGFSTARAADPAPEYNVWHNESQAGVTDVAGNTDSEAYNLQQVTTYHLDPSNLAKFSARYLRAEANGTESARNWDGSLRYERTLSADLSAFASFGLDSDIYAGFVQRNNQGAGVVYYFTRSPDTTWSGEIGYQYSFTQYVGPTNYAETNGIKVRSDISQNILPTVQFKFFAEYIPSVTDINNNYLFNAQPSLSVMMNSVFSLQASYLFKYHSVLPAGITKNLDTFFITSIVAKF